MSKRYSLPTALMLIVFSIFFVSGGTFTLIKFKKKSHFEKFESGNYQITKLSQTGIEKKALKSGYLAELLQLSIDEPKNIYLFDEKKGEELLLASPLIKSAKITKKKPDTLLIDYTVRYPLALLKDIKDGAFDEEGVLFPIKHFYTPKNLPVIFFGLDALPNWKDKLEGKRFQLVVSLLDLLQDKQLEEIDVSNAYAETLGKREIVIKIHNNLLRLSTKDYLQELGNYFTLRDRIRCEDQVIDLRISNLAYIGDKE